MSHLIQLNGKKILNFDSYSTTLNIRKQTEVCILISIAQIFEMRSKMVGKGYIIKTIMITCVQKLNK